MNGRVLVVDDKASVRSLLERLLVERFDVVTAADGAVAIAMLSAGEFDLVVSDIRMPGADGIEVLRAVKASAPRTEVILMTAFASVQSAVEAMRAGAYDYLPKPFDPDEAVVKIERAVEYKLLRDRAQMLAREVEDRYRFDRLLGRSKPMQRVFTLLEKAASHDLTVLLEGESGTGKELAARAIHFTSARKSGPFVAANCGAIPAELVESELFGHVKGSFTGAIADKRGLFEEARGGTLFLDEVGELPLAQQVKLNRALQEREFRRVGESRDRRVESRIVAATNVDVRTAVREGRFREDLFYRLNVFSIRLPTLRERLGDVPLLASTFLERFRVRNGGGPTGIAPDALRAITAHAWPGNVRQLENAIERACAVADGDSIGHDDLPAELTEPSIGGLLAGDALARLPYREAMDLLQDKATREYLTSLLQSSGGNVSQAAERAGVARESLHRLLRKHHVDPDRFRS